EHLGPRDDVGFFIQSNIKSNGTLQQLTVRQSFNQCKRNPSMSILESVTSMIDDIYDKHALSPRWASCRDVMRNRVPYRSVLEHAFSGGNEGMLVSIRRRLDELGHTDVVKRVYDQLSDECKKNEHLNATSLVTRFVNAEGRRIKAQQAQEHIKQN
ncbi:hypothetical protein Q3O60_17625, partial [Alkalimonas collagenimarina]